jgi:hypothetical protein
MFISMSCHFPTTNSRHACSMKLPSMMTVGLSRCGFLFSLILVACSSIPDQPVPAYVEPSPPAENAIFTIVTSVGAQAKLIAPLEVSDVRKIILGPGAYFICIREANPAPDKPRMSSKVTARPSSWTSVSYRPTNLWQASLPHRLPLHN